MDEQCQTLGVVVEQQRIQGALSLEVILEVGNNWISKFVRQGPRPIITVKCHELWLN